jgi:hypothetical protein
MDATKQDAIDDRDTRAVAPEWNDRPMYDQRSQGAPCSNCGGGFATHFRVDGKLMCSETMLRATYGDR